MALVMTKQGKLPAEKLYDGVCSTCKSEYEARQADLAYEADFHESYWKHPCQLCQNTVYFNQRRK